MRIKLFEHFIAKDWDIVSELRKSSKWSEVVPDRDHIACQFEYPLNDEVKAVIIGLDKVNGLDPIKGRIISLNLYLKYDNGLYYTDSVTQPYNRNHSSYRHTNSDIVKWCELVAKDQLQYFTEREKLPTDNELKDIFAEITDDMGYLLDDIKYGYMNAGTPKYNGTNVYDYDEDPFFTKSHINPPVNQGL